MDPVCVAIYDQKACTFTAPFFYSDLATAERAFCGLLAEGHSTPAQWPEDFSLYHLGTITPSSGKLCSLDHPALIITGQSAMLAVQRLRRGGSELSRGEGVTPPSEDSGASAERNVTPADVKPPVDDNTPALFTETSTTLNNKE